MIAMPLPTSLALYISHLPLPFHIFAIFMLYIVEIPLPLILLLPDPILSSLLQTFGFASPPDDSDDTCLVTAANIRIFGFCLILGQMFMIQCAGNFGIFPLLTSCLALTVLRPLDFALGLDGFGMETGWEVWKHRGLQLGSMSSWVAASADTEIGEAGYLSYVKEGLFYMLSVAQVSVSVVLLGMGVAHIVSGHNSWTTCVAPFHLAPFTRIQRYRESDRAPHTSVLFAYAEHVYRKCVEVMFGGYLWLMRVGVQFHVSHAYGIFPPQLLPPVRSILVSHASHLTHSVSSISFCLNTYIICRAIC